MGEWSNLTQREKSNIIRFAIKNGVSDINQIRDTFNVYAGGSGHIHEGTTSDSKLRIPTKEEYIADKIDSVRVSALESARKTPSEQSIRFYRYDPEAAKQHRDINNPDNFMTGTMFNALVDKYLGDIDRAKQEYHSYLYNNNPGYAASYDKYQEALKHGDYIEQANCIANLSRFYPKGLPNGNQTFAASPSKWGFTKIDTWDVMPGDLVQHLDQNGVPGHAMMYNGIDKKGVPSFNYASGSGPNSWGVGKHYPDAVSSDKKHLWDVDVYRYTGTPQDSIQWINEWAQKYIQNNEFAEGGKIHIKPSKRGTFTAAATKHGKSVQEFARQVLANKENYSPAMVKKANFARNAAHWHFDGGSNWLPDFAYNPTSTTEEIRMRLLSQQLPTTATAQISSTTKEDIERRKKETERLEFAQKIRPTLEQAVNTMAIGSNFNTSTMSNEALLDLGSRLSDQWNTVLMAATPIESITGIATGKLGEKGAIRLNNALDTPISDEIAAIMGGLVGGIAGARRGNQIMPNLRTSVYNNVDPWSYFGHSKDLGNIAKDMFKSTLYGTRIKPLSYIDKMKKASSTPYSLENVARDFLFRDRLGIPISKTTYNNLIYPKGKPFSIKNQLPFIVDATTKDGTHIVHFNPAWGNEADAYYRNRSALVEQFEQDLSSPRKFDMFTGAGASVGQRLLPKENAVQMFDRWDTRPIEHFIDASEIFKYKLSQDAHKKLPSIIKNFDPIELIGVRPAPIQSNVNPIGNRSWNIFNTTSTNYNIENAEAIRSLFSTGGPLYPFSFQKNPYWKTPVVRYDEGGILGHQYGIGDFLSKLFAPTYSGDFSTAFAKARNDRNSYFKWNGNRYSTQWETEKYREEHPEEYVPEFAYTDAMNRIAREENTKLVKNGYIPELDAWQPHKSVEGGAKTIGYGLKLGPHNQAVLDELERNESDKYPNGYISDAFALQQSANLLRDEYEPLAKKYWNSTFNDDSWDNLSPKMKSIILDYQYNVRGGIKEFPKLMRAIHDKDYEGIKANYKRYTNNKRELGRNKGIYQDLERLFGGYYSVYND